MYKLNMGWFWGALLAVAAGCGQGGPGASSGALGSQASRGTGPVTVSNGGAGGGGTGGADAGATAPARLTDAQVLTVLRTANQGEVDQAKAALTCATNADVQAFAQKMIADHGMALTRLDTLIGHHGTADSPESSSLMDVGQEQLKSTTEDSQSGGCDRVYLKVQIDAPSPVLGLINELLTPSAQAADVQAEVKA